MSMGRLTAGVLFALSLVLGPVPVEPVHAATAQENTGSEFLARVNDERARHHLPSVVHDPGLEFVARDWSTRLAGSQRLAHRPDLASMVDRHVTTQWTRIGENVGRGRSVESLHSAFMASASHRRNVLGQFNRLGVGVVNDGDDVIWVTFNFLDGPTICGADKSRTPNGDFWLAARDGGVFSFGRAEFMGSVAGRPLKQPVVGMAATPDAGGYWLAAADGGVFSFGDASFHGSAGSIRLRSPVVDMASTPRAGGYWLAAADGGVFNYGGARFHGSTGSIRLNSPVVDIAPTPTGDGYWLAAADGGVFSFGDARFHGSAGSIRLRSPVVDMAPTRTGLGYWLVTADGGVFNYGDATFHGSGAGAPPPTQIAEIGPTADDGGYWLVGQNGQLLAFGNAGSGTTAPICPSSPLVGMAVPGRQGG